MHKKMLSDKDLECLHVILDKRTIYFKVCIRENNLNSFAEYPDFRDLLSNFFSRKLNVQYYFLSFVFSAFKWVYFFRIF